MNQLVFRFIWLLNMKKLQYSKRFFKNMNLRAFSIVKVYTDAKPNSHPIRIPDSSRIILDTMKLVMDIWFLESYYSRFLGFKIFENQSGLLFGLYHPIWNAREYLLFPYALWKRLKIGNSTCLIHMSNAHLFFVFLNFFNMK